MKQVVTLYKKELFFGLIALAFVLALTLLIVPHISPFVKTV